MPDCCKCYGMAYRASDTGLPSKREGARCAAQPASTRARAQMPSCLKGIIRKKRSKKLEQVGECQADKVWFLSLYDINNNHMLDNPPFNGVLFSPVHQGDWTAGCCNCR